MKKNTVHDGKNNNKRKSNALDLISEEQLKGFLKNGLVRLGFGVYLTVVFLLMRTNNVIILSAVMAAPLILYSYLTNSKKFLDNFPMIVGKNLAFMFGLQMFMKMFFNKPLLGSIILFGVFAVYRLYKGKNVAGDIIRGIVKQEKERWRKK